MRRVPGQMTCGEDYIEWTDGDFQVRMVRSDPTMLNAPAIWLSRSAHGRRIIVGTVMPEYNQNVDEALDRCLLRWVQKCGEAWTDRGGESAITG